MLYTSPFGEQVYVQAQSSLLAINNTAGVWNSAGAQYIRVSENSLHMAPEEPYVETNIKHGTASQLARLTGRKSAQWSMNCPIAPSGTQGVSPDTDLLFQSVFGGAGSLVTGSPLGNAWQYGIYDRTAIPLFIAGFQKGSPSTGNRYISGAIPTRCTIDFNGNILGMSLTGAGVASMDESSFSTVTDSEARGGLGTFPTIPSSFSINGNLINAFGGTLTINGVVLSDQCDSLQLEFETGMLLKGNFTDSAYPVANVFNVRSARVTLGFANNDSSALAGLKVLGRSKTPVTVQFVLGSVAGYRMYVQVNGVQLLPGTLTDAQGYVACSFGQAASSVTTGNSNDLVIGFA